MPDQLPKVYIGGAESNGDVHMWAVDERTGQIIAEHICSHRSYGRHDLHDRRPDLYEKHFGGFGDGKYYQIVQVHTWSDVPKHVRILNAAGVQDRCEPQPVTVGEAAR